MKSYTSTFTAIGSRTVESVRSDFPILSGEGTSEIAYLDNAATSHKPRMVIDAIRAYYEEANSNVHRAVHRLAAESTRRYEEARKKVASFIGAESERSIVFTRGTTEAINLVAGAWGGAFFEAGDVVILSEMEHHSNLIPWQLLAARTGSVSFLSMLPADSSSTASMICGPIG